MKQPQIIFASSHQFALFTALLLLGLSQAATSFAQGSLTPPGAPAPTMKSLAQIEPRTPITSLPFFITNSGSYYVVSNLTGVVGSDGILITTNNVTIDLGGFALLGPAGGIAENGISSGGSRSNIVVRHGMLSGWSRSGILGSALLHCIVEDLVASENGFTGILVGDNSIVQRCSARRNGLNSSSQSGIWVGFGATVADCTVSGHNGSGSIGIRGDSSDVIQNCTIAENNSTNGAGISVNSYCVITHCVVSNNRGGTNNQGIYAGLGSQVKNCVVSINTGDGIVAFDSAYVLENDCLGNGGFGITLTGSNARVDGNHVADNVGGGIKVSMVNGGNLIVRNSSFNNPPAYSIASGNRDALILSPGSAFTSSGPWVNFQ